MRCEFKVIYLDFLRFLWWSLSSSSVFCGLCVDDWTYMFSLVYSAFSQISLYFISSLSLFPSKIYHLAIYLEFELLMSRDSRLMPWVFRTESTIYCQGPLYPFWCLLFYYLDLQDLLCKVSNLVASSRQSWESSLTFHLLCFCLFEAHLVSPCMLLNAF